MQLIAPLRALSTLFVTALLLAPACGEPGEPGTTESTSDQTATDASSTGETSSNPTTGGPGTTDDSGTTAGPGTTDDSGTTRDSDDSAGEPGSCAEWCQQMSACTEFTVEQCTAQCEGSEQALRTCLLACDQTQCEDLLMCTTVCAHPGDPNATPYAPCGEDASTCAPGVYLCTHSAHDGLEFAVCTPFCDDDDQCPTPATGDATPTCDLNGEPHLCSLDCSQGQQCPDDMVCDLQGSGACMWPVE